MNYFCDVHIQSAKNAEKRVFVVLNDISEGNQPEMTKEILVENNQYKDFCQKYKPKFIMADYVMYSTEADVFASSQDEVFEELISSGQVQRIAQSEIRIDNAKAKSNAFVKRKKKRSPLIWVIIIGGAVVLSIAMFGLGKKIGNSNVQNDEQANGNTTTNEDGMIIPIQDYIDENAEQITVSIDRSYSAVPTEDIQLKGEVIEGSASITLPEFDKTDFFSHVAGYTWGFTTNPEGKKIEYYGGNTYSFSKDTKLYRVLVKYGGGNGTKDDPYLIDYYDQLELMSEEKARGYFKQTTDIVFPEWASHNPINTVNELKSDPDSEYFEYDGGGYRISNLNNPLFGKVSGAVIKNVNITNSRIESMEYKDYGFIVCDVYNYSYETESGEKYETGETLIQHCSVSHSTISIQYPESDEPTTVVVTAPVVVPPDLVEYDEDGNIIEPTTEPVEPTKHGEYCIGAVSGLGGQIENCYVTDFGIYTYLDDYYLYVGGLSGKPANVMNSVVYSFTAKGNIFNAGGVVGNCGGSRLYNAMGQQLPSYYGGNIQGCIARNITLTTEVAVGGIAGEGSTNVKGAVISNCYANELAFTVGVYDDETNKLKKAGFSGGVIGTDGNETNGHLLMNTVSLADLNAIGNRSVSSYDDSIRLAPAYAFYQENILTVINKNTIDPNNPKEIYTGNFVFGDSSVFGDDSGSLAYPAEIEDLFEKTIVEEEQ